MGPYLKKKKKEHDIYRFGRIRVQDADRARFFFRTGFLTDTFRALDMEKLTRMEHLEWCESLLQVWFLEHIQICHPILIKGAFHENLIKAHTCSSSQESFQRRGDRVIFCLNSP